MVLSIQMLNTVVENTIEKSLTDITEILTEIMIIGDFICFSDHRSFTCPSEQAPNPESTNVSFDLLKFLFESQTRQKPPYDCLLFIKKPHIFVRNKS